MPLKGGGRDDQDKRADDVKRECEDRGGLEEEDGTSRRAKQRRGAGALELSTRGPTASLHPICALMDQQKGKVLPPKKVE